MAPVDPVPRRKLRCYSHLILQRIVPSFCFTQGIRSVVAKRYLTYCDALIAVSPEDDITSLYSLLSFVGIRIKFPSSFISIPTCLYGRIQSLTAALILRRRPPTRTNFASSLTVPSPKVPLFLILILSTSFVTNAFTSGCKVLRPERLPTHPMYTRKGQHGKSPVFRDENDGSAHGVAFLDTGFHKFRLHAVYLAQIASELFYIHPLCHCPSHLPDDIAFIGHQFVFIDINLCSGTSGLCIFDDPRAGTVPNCCLTPEFQILP